MAFLQNEHPRALPRLRGDAAFDRDGKRPPALAATDLAAH